MYHPALDEVKVLAENYNLVSIWRELPADLETPVSVYLKLRGEGPSFLLESVKNGEQLGRYSFLGFEPTALLRAQDGRVDLLRDGIWQAATIDRYDPLAVAEELLSRYHPAPDEALPEFYGGLVGYMGYDAVRCFERAPLAEDPGLGLPDAMLMQADTLVIFDHVRQRLLVVANAFLEGDATAAYAGAVDRIERLIARLQQPLRLSATATAAESVEWDSTCTQADFEAAVRQAGEYIAAGDIFQVVLSQRLSRRTTAEPFAIYRALRRLNPSPYMFYLEFPDDLRLIGSSPEVLVQLNGRRAMVRPIAGTRPRGRDAAADQALVQELLADPKERAEHVMLVDLGRNDLGRVCQYGTVSVTELMTIEYYSHVMHLVSEVEGELQPGLTAFDLLRATFPAGTVSGAPKVRAMEIIAELEKSRRGPYAGAVGYFGYGGALDTCIAIRTLVMQGDRVHAQAGAGIVADSDPTREYQETLNKARALAQAVLLAEKGNQ